MNVICDMIEQTSIKHERLIKQLTAPLQSFGISYFCYQFVSNEGHWFTLGNNPDWLFYCAENEFFRFDPSLVRPNYYNASSVCFPKYHQHELFQQTLIGQFTELFELDHTLAFIEPTLSGCEYYFFAAPKAHAKVLNIYLNQLNRLRIDYTHYLKTQLQSIVPHCLEHTVDLSQINSSGFNSKHNLLLADHSTIQQESAFLNSIQPSPQLTSREYQCLQLYQHGLTAKQTAYQLGISYRTIERHFDNLKIKYQVNHKRELLNKLLHT